MNDLKIFNSEQFGKIRAQEIDGEPWFCLADVCKPLGLRSYHCKERLKPEGIVTRDTPTKSGVQGMLWVNEGNLYRAIFQSKKPEAEAFTDWVTEEVLPALRRTGSYSMAPTSMVPTPQRVALPEGISLNGLARLLSITRRMMLDMGNTPVEIGAVAKGLCDTCGIQLHPAFTSQIPGQLDLFNRPGLEA